MTDQDQPLDDVELQLKASRARSIIYWAMFVMMVLPMLLAWFTGALRF